MNDEDAKKNFRLLAEILRSAGLDWLVDEALAEIRRAKPKEKKVKVSGSSEFFFLGSETEEPRAKSAKFVESIEYSPSEQLEILISALERGVVAPTIMEDEVATVLSKAVEPSAEDLGPIRFRFLAEGEGTGPRESTHDERERRKAVGEHLLHLTNSTREAIHAPD